MNGAKATRRSSRKNSVRLMALGNCAGSVRKPLPVRAEGLWLHLQASCLSCPWIIPKIAPPFKEKRRGQSSPRWAPVFWPPGPSAGCQARASAARSFSRLMRPGVPIQAAQRYRQPGQMQPGAPFSACGIKSPHIGQAQRISRYPPVSGIPQ